MSISIPCEIHWWSGSEDIRPPDEKDAGVFRYHGKEEEVDEDDPLERARHAYTIQRGIKWHGKAGRSWSTLRNSPTLKDVEKLLESGENSLVYGEWRDGQSYMMIFSDGNVVLLEISLGSGDVTGLRLVKLKAPGAISSVGGRGKTLFLCGQSRWLAVMPSPLSANAPEEEGAKGPTFGSTTTLRKSKLSLVESFSLGGDVYEVPGRGAEGEGCAVYLDNPVFPAAVLVCWKGMEGCTSVAPWHPTSSKLLDAANVLLYTCDSEQRVQLSGWLKTEGAVVDAAFIATRVSDQASISFCTLEVPLLRRESLFVKVSDYDSGVGGCMGITGGVWQVGVTQIPLGGLLTASAFSPLSLTNHTVNLVMACEDKVLILHSFTRWSTVEPTSKKLNMNFVASCISWHQDGVVFAVGGTLGEIMIFDLALNVVRLVTSCQWLKKVIPDHLNLGEHSRHRLNIASIRWNPVTKTKSFFKHDTPDSSGLLVQTQRGPLCFVLVPGNGFPSPWSLSSMASLYMKFHEPAKAVSLLVGCGWQGDGTEAMAALSIICNQLMRANQTQETLGLVQTALGSFHSSKKPLTSQIVSRHGSFVRDLTRRFFLLLLRNQDWVTSFRLALDLGDPDLFLDLHHCGKAIGDADLASSALAHMQYLTGTSGQPEKGPNDDVYKVFSGSVGGTFNVLEKPLRNLKLSLRGIESAPTPTPTAAVQEQLEDNDDEDDDEEEEGVEVVHFGVV